MEPNLQPVCVCMNMCHPCNYLLPMSNSQMRKIRIEFVLRIGGKFPNNVNLWVARKQFRRTIISRALSGCGISMNFLDPQ